jgi:hypothetical protein
MNSKQKIEIRKRIEKEKNRGLAYLATAHRTSPLGAQLDACCGTVDVNHRPVGNPKRKL